MKVSLLALLSVALSTPLAAQVVAAGKAETRGACSPAVSGSHNNFVIKCGIDAAQGKEMIELLNRVLSSPLGTDVVIKKLDEILASNKGNQNQSNSGGSNFQQNSTGPNSPNIAGNDNQVTYSNTSEIPLLSAAQMTEIGNLLSSTRYKIRIKFNASDSDANVFASDLLGVLKGVGWDADFIAGLGGSGIQISVPILIGVNSPPAVEAAAVQKTLQNVLGMKIPGVVDASIPAGEVDIFLLSRPIRRPQ